MANEQNQANPPVNINNLFGAVRGDAALTAEITQRVARRAGEQAALQADINLENVEPNQTVIEAVLLMNANGTTELEAQAVTVEFLRNDQKLILPAALGMSWTEGGPMNPMVQTNALLRARYCKVANMTYAQIRALFQADSTMLSIREAVDELPAVARANRATNWLVDGFFTLPDGTIDVEHAMYMTVLSQALQFNCDLRDFGFLNTAEGTITDDAWKTASTVTRDRLRQHLQHHTILVIAALNLPNVNSCALAAFVRGYGVALGVMPARTSLTQVEYRFTNRNPPTATMTTIANYYKAHETGLFALSANLIAMFGLFHLNKDHTYKTGDANLGRIGTSYLTACRTIPGYESHGPLEGHKEALVRTASHPFGLAQTYWLAKAMHTHKLLAKPLMIRHDTLPPTVQRIAVAHTGMSEWLTMPVGKNMQDAYYDEYKAIAAAVEAAKESPPSFSDLHRMYGVELKSVFHVDVKNAVDAVMPAVYGYVMAVHVEDGTRREGLGHSMALNNVARDMGALTKLWTSAWEKYFGRIDGQGLEEFAATISSIRRRTAPAADVAPEADPS